MSSQIRTWLDMAGAEKIQESGSNTIACCPFHSDRHRSFSMSNSTGQFICFSESCGMQGGLSSFLIEACGYSLKDAKRLSEEYGADQEDPLEGWATLPDWKDRRKVTGVKKAAKSEALLGLYDFVPQVLLDRGFRKSLLRDWEIGYDVETNHVTIPVRDHTGTLIGFTKRADYEAMESPDGAKYLHMGFERMSVLYGAYRVKDPRTARVWVGEGSLDALALRQMGAEWVTSTMGARVSKDHVSQLLKYAEHVLAYDNPEIDKDGDRATRRIGDALLEAGKRSVFVACDFGKRKDPADMLLASERRQRRFMTTLVPYSEWRFERDSGRRRASL